MGNNLLKKVGVIVMAASLFGLIGCGSLDQKQASAVEKALEEKYHKAFKVTDIGGRYGTGRKDSVTTYAHPVDQENVAFIVFSNNKGEIRADTYIQRLISDSLNNVLKQKLESAGIESETLTITLKVDDSSEVNPDITLEQYVSTHKPGYFSADMIVKESPDLMPEQFEQALKAVYEAGLQTTFQVHIHVIAGDQYDEVKTNFVTLPEVMDSWFSDYNVTKEMKVSIDAEGFHIN